MIHPKPTKRPKGKKPSATTAKAKAWKAFSMLIRTRDCLKTTGRPDMGACYTCGHIYPIGQLQAGHFVPGRTGANLWDKRGVHAQCYRCNGPLKGNWPEYFKNMRRDYGDAVVHDLLSKAHIPTLFKTFHYIEMEARFKAELKEISASG